MKLWSRIEARLVEDWHHVARRWSTRLNGAGLTLLSGVQIVQETWNQMPADLRHLLPYARGVSIALFAAGLLASLLKPRAQKTDATMEAHNGD